MATTDPEDPAKPPLSDPDDPHRPAPPTAAAAATVTATTIAAAANGSTPAENRNTEKKRKAEGGEGCRACSCKKSKCLKLYCVCFASGEHCSESCGCEPCFNKAIHGAPGKTPVFPLKIGQTLEAGQDPGEQLIKSPLDLIKRKCTCKKSGCRKKYCDCYQGRAGCSIYCKCDDCRNPFGRKVGIILEGRNNLIAPNERNGTDFDSSDNHEDDCYTNKPLSPISPSPVSRESSFQQETLVGVEVQTVNGHLYPKPLSQMRPEPWQLARRPTDEARVEQWRFWRRPSEDGTADVMEGYKDSKFQRESERPWNREDRYSIPRCIEVMNGMVDLSQVEKSLAPDVFLELSNREIFLSLSVDVRTMWLRRKIKCLT